MQRRRYIEVIVFCLIAMLVSAGALAGTVVKGDIRGGYYASRTDERNGTVSRVKDARARARVGAHTDFSETLKGNVRFAGHYTEDDRSRSFGIHEYNNAMTFGNSTLDTANVNYRPNNNWDITAGRMQTKFELMGVPKKSLDRNDSPNVDIDFTDGIHAVHRHESGWQTHVILQHNPGRGSTNVTRSPLNFADSGTRLSYFAGVENKKKSGPFIQRGLDLTFMPDALLVTGSSSGPRDDYYGVVGRAAMQWPLGSGGMHFLLGGEIGYAPETPQKSALKIGGTEKANGTAWLTSFNLMNFRPSQSIGLILARAEAGWLLSPDFRQNESLVEVRHRWNIRKWLYLETRVRDRKELEKQTTAAQKRDAKDLYIRLTYKFGG